MYIIDTHAHLYGEEFTEDIDAVVERARQNGVGKIFLPNIDEATIPAMNRLVEKYPGYFYPMMGIHPTDLPADYCEVLRRMEQLVAAENHPYIAIGEVGLDYYWDDSMKKEQQAAFDFQVQLSLKYDLPLMIHCRSAHADLVQILNAYRNEPLRGVFHSFVGTGEEAAELLSFNGFMLGINGIVTFKKSELPATLSAQVPLSRLVLETDSPYLAPVPHRGKRNESSYLPQIVQKLSAIYACDAEEIVRQTMQNALSVFDRVRDI